MYYSISTCLYAMLLQLLATSCSTVCIANNMQYAYAYVARYPYSTMHIHTLVLLQSRSKFVKCTNVLQVDLASRYSSQYTNTLRARRVLRACILLLLREYYSTLEQDYYSTSARSMHNMHTYHISTSQLVVVQYEYERRDSGYVLQNHTSQKCLWKVERISWMSTNHF